jgi:hypothetical protein
MSKKGGASAKDKKVKADAKNSEQPPAQEHVEAMSPGKGNAEGKKNKNGSAKKSKKGSGKKKSTTSKVSAKSKGIKKN